MKILVCVKQVIDIEQQIDIREDRLWIVEDEDTRYHMNYFDEFAVEEAVRIKEQLADVTIDVLTMGPARAESTLRRALALGADNAVHIQTHKNGFLPAEETAYQIAEFIKNASYKIILSILRSRLISSIRDFLTMKEYIEVETPMMQAIAGGATARPFITHHNALDIDLYMRIAPELYLKRLLVGGFEKIFELNRNFRNEGISTKHNPEFTMLELYQAYADYNDMIDIAQEMISTIAYKLMGKMAIDYQGHTIDLTPPWEKITFIDVIKKYTGIDFNDIKTKEEAKKAAASANIEVEKNLSIWKIASEIFDEKVEHRLIQPTLVIDYPRELSPLSKSKDDHPNFVERFEPFIGGRELGNAFTELNDPFDQKARFEEQMRMREAGDEEAQMMDYDYLCALEHGMPPAAGMGIGIDRLAMLFMDTVSIKDTILFPLLKPEK